MHTYLGEDNVKSLVNFCLHYIADLDLPIKRYPNESFHSHLMFANLTARFFGQDSATSLLNYIILLFFVCVEVLLSSFAQAC
ncbi:hypothetical protein EON65_10210 [archaeon]|nr:MAG: hypothetical protein EON65_10210 [archaeon]